MRYLEKSVLRNVALLSLLRYWCPYCTAASLASGWFRGFSEKNA